jgi:hypothetical protein
VAGQDEGDHHRQRLVQKKSDGFVRYFYVGMDMEDQARRAVRARYPKDELGNARLVRNFEGIEKYEVREILCASYRGPAIP